MLLGWGEWQLYLIKESRTKAVEIGVSSVLEAVWPLGDKQGLWN